MLSTLLSDSSSSRQLLSDVQCVYLQPTCSIASSSTFLCWPLSCPVHSYSTTTFWLLSGLAHCQTHFYFAKFLITSQRCGYSSGGDHYANLLGGWITDTFMDSPSFKVSRLRGYIESKSEIALTDVIFGDPPTRFVARHLHLFNAYHTFICKTNTLLF